MTSKELDSVEQVCEIFKDLTKVPCTGCAYCMPCPAGVNIPLCFEKYNSKSYFGGLDPKLLYLVQAGVLSDNPAMASKCIGCGKCEKHCPQHIKIREELKNVTAQLEGAFDKPLIWMIKRVMRRSGK